MRRFLFLLALLCFALPSFAQDEQTPYEIALQRIQEAEASGATELDLSVLELTELPPEIGNLVNLEALYLNYTAIQYLPQEIGNLRNLEILSLYTDELIELPAEIGNLTNLHRLSLSSLKLSNLPSEIGNLTHLQELNISGPLTNLPPEIGNLHNLQLLSLYGTPLTNLPPEIGNLIHLRIFYLEYSHVHTLPPEIGNLTNLCHLSLHGNSLLQYLPTELSQIESLQGENCGIFLDGNPLISPPQEVIAQGTPAIFDYLEEEAWWWHLQRLILGAAGSVGIVAAVILGLRWRNRGKQKRKHE